MLQNLWRDITLDVCYHVITERLTAQPGDCIPHPARAQPRFKRDLLCGCVYKVCYKKQQLQSSVRTLFSASVSVSQGCPDSPDLFQTLRVTVISEMHHHHHHPGQIITVIAIVSSYRERFLHRSASSSAAVPSGPATILHYWHASYAQENEHIPLTNCGV